jgi:cysteine desulfurase
MEAEHMSDGTHPALAGGPIYLDYNATTPVDPAVAEAAALHLTTHFGNPSSTHAYADAPRRAVADARAEVAELLGCEADEVVFTGGGSESDNLAVRGMALAAAPERDHIVTQVTEHPGVLEAARALERIHGLRVTYLPVDGSGLVHPDALDAAIGPRTALVSIMHANNETGTVQPIRELAAVAHAHGVPFHTDAAQTIGKITVDVSELGVDLLTVAGHKLYAPKGVGALYVRRALQLEPLIYGGGQERGLRAGTENVALAAALGAAAHMAKRELTSSEARLTRLRDALQRQLEDLMPGRVHLNGHPVRRLPNTLNVSIDGERGDALLAAVPGVAAATGSACHEGRHEPSPVLSAMGISADRARSALRLSIGRWTSEGEIEEAARLLARR